jgi:cell division protein FtsB
MRPRLMATRQRKQSRVRPLFLPAVCLLLLGYFGYHAVEGNYGQYALVKLQARETGLGDQLAGLKEERQVLDRRVSLMRPESLDPDMIEERARRALNVARVGDIVILRNITR